MADDLSKLINSINKDLKGAARISNISDVATPYETRRSTGILSIDTALNGGFPAGTLCQIFGPDGVGKDYLTNRMMAENQHKYGDKSNIFWLSFGYRPDRDFMRMSGVQLPMSDQELSDRGIDLAGVSIDIRGEQIGNILFVDIGNELALDNPAETMLSAALKLIQSNKFQLGIINELGSGETKDNVVKGLHESAKIATWASLMSDFCRKFYSSVRVPDEDGRPNETCVMMINPVRANMDAHSSKFNPYTQSGGHALKHAKTVDLHMKVGKFIRKGTTKIGKEIKWRVAKGKHGISEGAEGEYRFIFNQGVDLISDLANTAKAYGIVQNSGRYYQILDYEDRIEGGLEGVISVLRQSPSICQEVRQAVLERFAKNQD